MSRHRSKSAIRSFVASLTKFEDSGAASADCLVDKMSENCKAATNEHNRITLISIGCAALYAVKALGLRLDVIFLQQKIFELPYGIFIFCIVAQILYIASCIRQLDARVMDRYLKAVCEAKWGQFGDIVYQANRGMQEWSTVVQYVFSRAEMASPLKLLFNSAGVMAALVWLCISLSPIATGIHFLYMSGVFQKFSVSGFQEIIVTSLTLGSTIFFVLSFAFFLSDYDE